MLRPKAADTHDQNMCSRALLSLNVLMMLQIGAGVAMWFPQGDFGFACPSWHISSFQYFMSPMPSFSMQKIYTRCGFMATARLQLTRARCQSFSAWARSFWQVQGLTVELMMPSYPSPCSSSSPSASSSCPYSGVLLVSRRDAWIARAFPGSFRPSDLNAAYWHWNQMVPTGSNEAATGSNEAESCNQSLSKTIV